jgi:hypothetical protein
MGWASAFKMSSIYIIFYHNVENKIYLQEEVSKMKGSQNPSKLGRVVFAAGFYFLLCGISALLWPSSWYYLAGISGVRLDVSLGVIGVMMIALGVSACLTVRGTSDPRSLMPIFVSLLVANLGDLLVVLYYTLQTQLPAFNGICFILVDLTWVWLLWRVRPSPLLAGDPSQVALLRQDRDEATGKRYTDDR